MAHQHKTPFSVTKRLETRNGTRCETVGLLCATEIGIFIIKILQNFSVII